MPRIKTNFHSNEKQIEIHIIFFANSQMISFNFSMGLEWKWSHFNLLPSGFCLSYQFIYVLPDLHTTYIKDSLERIASRYSKQDWIVVSIYASDLRKALFASLYPVLLHSISPLFFPSFPLFLTFFCIYVNSCTIII